MRRTRSRVERRPDDAVSIDLCTPGPDLEGGSEKEARGHGVIASPKLWQITEEILKARKPTNKWNTTFIISCSLAVFIDPLYCYIHVIASSRNCYYRDKKLFWAYFGLRSATDVFYAMDIFYFLWSHRVKTSEIRRGRQQKRRKDESFLQACIHKLFPILPRILVALPIPEGLLIASKYTNWPKITTHALFISTPFQYSLRIYHIYGSLRRRPIIETGIQGRWLKAFLDFLPFIIASHESHERSKQLKQREKRRWMILDVDLWLSRNNIQAVKIENEKDKNLRDVIMENIDKLEVNKDIDVQNILSIIPLKDKKWIIYLLCLASLKKVPMCLNMNEKALKVICDHLKPAIYPNDHSIIIQEGKPLKKMLFITQGIAWTETSSGSSTTECLKKGDVFGGELLLDWAFKLASFSDLPISTRTVTLKAKLKHLL